MNHETHEIHEKNTAGDFLTTKNTKNTKSKNAGGVFSKKTSFFPIPCVPCIPWLKIPHFPVPLSCISCVSWLKNSRFQTSWFTMVEIVAVLMIFLLVVGFAVTSMRQIPALVSLQQVVNELKQQCAEARQTASCQRRNVCIRYENNSIQTEITEIILPDTLELKINGENIRQNNESHELFVFYPDGSGQEQKLKLTLGRDSVTLILSPLTGRLTAKNDETN